MDVSDLFVISEVPFLIPEFRVLKKGILNLRSLAEEKNDGPINFHHISSGLRWGKPQTPGMRRLRRGFLNA
jgi:hypothetical protein